MTAHVASARAPEPSVASGFYGGAAPWGSQSLALRGEIAGTAGDNGKENVRPSLRLWTCSTVTTGRAMCANWKTSWNMPSCWREETDLFRPGICRPLGTANIVLVILWARVDGPGVTERVMALRRRKYGIRYQDFRPGRK